MFGASTGVSPAMLRVWRSTIAADETSAAACETRTLPVQSARALRERLAQSLQMRAETLRVERVERPDIFAHRF